LKDVGQQSAAMASLRQAVPYIRMFKGKTFVVKVGGAALPAAPSLGDLGAATSRGGPAAVNGPAAANASSGGAVASILEQISVFHQVGIRVVLVHGGGPQSSALSRALGAEPRFVAGRRVTDDAALEVAMMVLNGAVNTRLLAACRAAGLPAVGLSGVAGGLIVARRRPPVPVVPAPAATAAGPARVPAASSGGAAGPGAPGAGGAASRGAGGPGAPGAGGLVDYGHVGDIVAINPAVLETLLDAGMVPVVSPLSADDGGALLNVNADTAAAALAVALRAEKLLVLTGAPGILERAGDPGSLVSLTDLGGLARLRDRGCLADGMLPKASSIEAALRGGVRRVHIVGADVADALLAEVFTNEGTGTLVVADAAAAAAGAEPGMAAAAADGPAEPAVAPLSRPRRPPGQGRPPGTTP
jgi:acetylglutamate kinase